MECPEIKKYLGFGKELKTEELSSENRIIDLCIRENALYCKSIFYGDRKFKVFLANKGNAEQQASNLYNIIMGNQNPEIKEYILSEVEINLDKGFSTSVSASISKLCKNYEKQANIINSQLSFADAKQMLDLMTIDTIEASRGKYFKIIVEGNDTNAGDLLLKLYSVLASRKSNDLNFNMFEVA
jgi:phosphotransferase system HPr-like phosphotransfer protein